MSCGDQQAPAGSSTPEINYLARDYTSLRQLMLDRMALLIPRWQERSPADLNMVLIELLAYVGDYLNYRQDAIATEAYLHTARKRISVRRHARLLDYFMHDGCNARVWVRIQVNQDLVLPEKTQLLTRVGQSTTITPNSLAYSQALEEGPEVFETMHGARLFKLHNELRLHHPEGVPQGATRAALAGWLPDLATGDVLLFQGPGNQGQLAVTPCHHPVRLTEVAPSKDPGGQRMTLIAWDKEDALPFPLSPGNGPCSLVLGNIVLADHGLTTGDGALEADYLHPGRFILDLRGRALTQAAPFDLGAPAAAALRWAMKDVLPALTLNNETWLPKRDLLASGSFAREFVAELDDAAAILRFGDGRHGMRPSAAELPLRASFRIGNGAGGNLGPGSITHIVSTTTSIKAVTNPLPARGGVDPETIAQVRQNAPVAFRVQERAVTPEDYAAVAARHPGVQRAVATFRWTGSWHTVFLTVDRCGGLEVDGEFKADLLALLERHRMAGYDVEIDSPRYVYLEIELQVTVHPDYFQGEVVGALAGLLHNRILPGGARGVFHPDNFSFGQPVYLSPLYAAALGVPGVASVSITKFQRLGASGDTALEEGKITLGRLEIARVDNDPVYPERGVCRIVPKGGK